MKALLTLTFVLLFLGSVAGCASAPGKPEPVIEVRTVNVAVPVPCSEPVPAEPDRPTRALPRGFDLDTFVAAATAELDLWHAYAGQLLTSLKVCTKPL